MSLLGSPYKSWRKAGLRGILSRYGRFPGKRATKLELMSSAQEAVEEHGASLQGGLTSEIMLELMTLAQAAAEKHRASEKRRHRSKYLWSQTRSRCSRSHRGLARSSSKDEGGESMLGQTETTLQTDGIIPDRDEIDRPGCSVCLDSFDQSNTPSRAITSLCRHKLNICKRCITTSISTQFSEKVWDHVECPSCKERLTYHDMETFADRETFEK